MSTSYEYLFQGSFWGSIGHAVLDCMGKDVMMSGNVTMRTMSHISFLLSSDLFLSFFLLLFSIWFLVELHDQGEYLLFIYLSIFFFHGKFWRLKTKI